MADRKITDLTALAAGSQATGDLLTIVDVSEVAAADKNKKITMENLFKGIPGDVGIGTTSPDEDLHVFSSTGAIKIDGSGDTALRFATSGTNKFSIFQSADTLRFFDNSNNSERMRIDSSGNVGIGTSSPGAALHIENTGSDAAKLRIGFDSTRYYDIFRKSSDGLGLLNFHGNQTGFTGYVFGGVDGERMRINSSGDVLIGTTSGNSERLRVQDNATTGTSCQLSIISGNAERGILNFGDAEDHNIGRISYNHSDNALFFHTNNTERLRIDSSGDINLPIAAANNATRTVSLRSDYGGGTFFDNAAIALVQDSSGSSGGHLRFLTTASGSSSPSERMRIDSSGNVGIGKTSSGNKLEIEGQGNTKVVIDARTDAANGSLSSLELWSKNGSGTNNFGSIEYDGDGNFMISSGGSGGGSVPIVFRHGSTERMRITSNGGLLVATTNATPGLGDTDTGLSYEFPNGAFFVSRGDNNTTVFLNKNSGSNSGSYMDFNKSGSAVGNIGHNGSGVVSYNNFQGSHLGRLVDRSAPDIKVGTLIEVTGTPLDYKCVPFTYTDVDGETQKMRKPWTGTEAVGATVSFDWNGTTYSGVVTDENAENDYEKSLYTQVCATAASKAVLGVFMCWDDDTKRLYTDSYNDMMVTSVGNFVVRMASGQTPTIGDLFESDANGCAVVQTDDIIRSKTVGKITSTEKQVVYDDGSFLVTCVLYSG